MNDPNRKPSDFNWVEARQQCSLQEVFEALRLGIRDDVETRNSNLPDNPDPHAQPMLKIVERGRTIRVYWHDIYGQYANLFVEFTLTAQNIVAKNHEGTLFEATVGLNDDGDCRVKMFGKEYDFWQVRRKALEHLMFNIPV